MAEPNPMNNGRVGKVVMAKVPLHLILIAIPAIRGITLPGPADGLNDDDRSTDFYHFKEK